MYMTASRRAYVTTLLFVLASTLHCSLDSIEMTISIFVIFFLTDVARGECTTEISTYDCYLQNYDAVPSLQNEELSYQYEQVKKKVVQNY